MTGNNSKIYKHLTDVKVFAYGFYCNFELCFIILNLQTSNYVFYSFDLLLATKKCQKNPSYLSKRVLMF